MVVSSSSPLKATTIALPKPPDGWFDYGYAILPDGKLGLMRCNTDVHAAYAQWRTDVNENPGKHGGFPDFSQKSACLSTFDGICEDRPIEIPFGKWPVFNRLADGRWLIAAARARENEINGRLIAADGALVGSIRLGDAISYLQCAPDGTIWVGYFDEGIFGDDPSTCPSACGIAQFSSDGTLLWCFNKNSGFICDCYAMSLSRNILWTCYYVDFPIVAADKDIVTIWTNNSISGASAIAVDGRYAMLFGGYDENANRLALLYLDDGIARCVGELALSAVPSQGSCLVQGQADTLHFIREGNWTKITVAAIRSAFGA